MSIATPGRNDPCPCGSGRKFKHCCLQARSAEDQARLRLRGAEGRVIEGTLRLAAEAWGEPLLLHAWDDFWNYDDVPEDEFDTTPEFEPMFIPWFTLSFVPDPEADDADPDWPVRPLALEWLDAEDDVPELNRAWAETACRSPLSVFVVEQVSSGRSLDVKDILTGRRFHALEQSGSQRLKPADLVFSRVVTIDGVSIMLGMAPFIVPPSWHTHIIDRRDIWGKKRLMTRADLEDFDIEIRDLYFEIAAELLAPTPPRLTNTDGDPLALTTLTYELKTTVADAFEKLLPLAVVHGEEHIDEVEHDASGAVTGASLTWIKAGNRQHKQWDNTVLGTMKIEASHLAADVNSARRADRLKREIARRLGKGATLVDTVIRDPGDLLEERARQRAAGAIVDEPEPEPPPELRAIQEEMLRRQWEGWLDMRVPALGNKTPRQAARTASGRERLEALLADFDRNAEHGPPGTRDHLGRLRNTLGISIVGPK